MDARSAGIETVYQTLAVAPGLDIADNLFLGREQRKPGVLGTLVGALIVGVFRNGLQLAGVQVVWQGFAIGLLVLVAVSIDQWIRKVKA